MRILPRHSRCCLFFKNHPAFTSAGMVLVEPFTRGNMDRLAVQSLDQGMFAFPRPKPIHVFGYAMTFFAVLTAVTMYSQSLSIPDVPRVEEATVLPYLHEDVSAYDFAPVQKGYDGDEYASEAAFILVPLELEGGTIATDKCRWVRTMRKRGLGIQLPDG